MARSKAPIYGADFETVVSKERTRVWLWGLVNFNTEEFEYGSDLDSFMERISKLSCTVYFHNLKFDVQFLFYWLFQHGFKHTSSKRPSPLQFSTLISDMGMFYTATICFENGSTLKLIDSLKLIPLAIDKMHDAFGLKYKKLDLDYSAVRDINHKPTNKEIEYVEHDVRILVGGVKAMHEQGLSKLTVASNALNNFKSNISKDRFNELFPPLTLTEDRDCRLAYKGGWTYVNPKYKGKDVGNGRVYDVNSMYPWAMKYCMLPYGQPKYFQGKYNINKEYPLYIQCMTCKFKLKKGKYPSIQLKGNMRFMDTEYIVESDEDTIITLTSVDIELFYENYDVYDEEFLGGYMFKGATGIMADYIDYWYGVKSQAGIDGNKALYTIAKLMLNSLYGKFGTNPKKRSKYPYYDEDEDVVRYENMAEEISDGGYVPIAAFITSYARDKIIRAANSCGDRFVYADTDSLHILGDEEPDIDIDSKRLGAFKCESEFTRARFLRTKCYIEEIEGNLNKKCAGLPKKAKEQFNFDTMVNGSQFSGKLVPVNVPGGVVLVDRIFTIK